MKRPLGIVHAIVDVGDAAALPEARERVRAMLEAGLPSLQLRGATAASEEHVAIGRWLREETQEAGAQCIVNSDVRLAVELGADGVHLRAGGPTPPAIRHELPPGVPVGASCHDSRELEQATEADWVFLSPVFPTPSKPGAAALGLERFAVLIERVSVPVYALGGVDAERFAACVAAGAAGVAAIRACWADPAHSLVRTARRWVRDRA
jgi:thiamine-phosphate diphosphorylase